MRVQSIRFGDFQWELISQMAEAEGVSSAQFIRDAAYARAIVHRLRRGEKALDLWLALTDSFNEHPDLLARLEALRESLDIELLDEPPTRP